MDAQRTEALLFGFFSKRGTVIFFLSQSSIFSDLIIHSLELSANANSIEVWFYTLNSIFLLS